MFCISVFISFWVCSQDWWLPCLVSYRHSAPCSCLHAWKWTRWQQSHSDWADKEGLGYHLCCPWSTAFWWKTSTNLCWYHATCEIRTWGMEVLVFWHYLLLKRRSSFITAQCAVRRISRERFDLESLKFYTGIHTDQPYSHARYDVTNCFQLEVVVKIP